MSLPIDVYEALKDAPGKARARKVVRGLEAAVETATTVRWAQVRDELLARLVSKKISK